MLTKSSHVASRMAERNLDDITLSILAVYGEQLDKRDGLMLSKSTAYELIDIARSMKPRQKRMLSI